MDTSAGRMVTHGAAVPAVAVDAVLFDMDGVVTDTARVHAAAWTRMFNAFFAERARAGAGPVRPFDEPDYRQLVDGRPRLDGVRRVLASRGIDLPYGDDADGPDVHTVCGLGNRKNREFRHWLRHHAVTPIPGAVRLIDDLGRQGVRLAVFSASRNAGDVLRSAGLLNRFDVRVDGTDLARRGLPGKPDPAMLLEAAARLGVPPTRAAVVEDAVAGIEAGVRGGFALVLGIERDPASHAMRRAGADAVAHDVAELAVTADRRLTLRTVWTLPLLVERQAEIASRLSRRTLAVVLDLDGHVAPGRSSDASLVVEAALRHALAALAARQRVVVFGRQSVEALYHAVRLDVVHYAGALGRELLSPLAADARGERPHATMHGAGEGWPRAEGGKGEALLRVLAALHMDSPEVRCVYVGGGLGDESVFRILAGRGLSSVMRSRDDRVTAADYTLADVDHLAQALRLLAEVRGRE